MKRLIVIMSYLLALVRTVNEKMIMIWIEGVSYSGYGESDYRMRLKVACQ